MASKIVNTRLVHFPYDVKLRLLAHSRSYLANQKARNAIVGAQNLLRKDNVMDSKESLLLALLKDLLTV